MWLAGMRTCDLCISSKMFYQLPFGARLDGCIYTILKAVPSPPPDLMHRILTNRFPITTNLVTTKAKVLC